MKKVKAFGVILTSFVATMMCAAVVSASPTNVKQTGSSATSVSVEWEDENLNTTYYTVQISPSATDWESDSVKTINSVYGKDETIYSLAKGKTYYIRVASRDNTDWTTPIEVVTAPDTSNLTNDSLVETDATETTATLSWGAATGATGYEIYASATNNSSDDVYVKTVNTNKATINVSGETYVAIYAIRKSSTGYIAKSSYSDASKYNILPLPKKFSKPKVAGYYPASKKITVVSSYNRDIHDGWEVQYGKANSKSTKRIQNTYSYETDMDVPVANNSFYKVRARGYIVCNGVKKYGKWSAYNYVCQDVSYSATAKNVSTYSKRKIRLSWKKIKGAKNYTIYASKDKDKGYKKVKTTKKRVYYITNFRKKSLKKNVHYYFIIVANKKVGKKTYKSGKQYCRDMYFY